MLRRKNLFDFSGYEATQISLIKTALW